MAVPAPPARDAASSSLLRAATWVAIAALVAAALVCVVWVLVGDDDGIVGKAFLTVLLLAGFAGVAILEARLAPGRPAWFVLTSMVVWVVVLLIGALFIWLPPGDRYSFLTGPERFFKYGLVVAVLGLALLHVRLYLRAHARYVTPFTRATAAVTVGLVALLAILLVVPLVIDEYVEFPAVYWRITVALAILAAVGTALLPLLKALFGSREPRPARPVTAWPTYADGRTPLPVLPGGTPDWTAYHTGRPSVPLPGHPGVTDPFAPPPPSIPGRPVAVPARPAPPLPPPPTAPFSAAPPSASPAPTPSATPFPARSHGWWGGQSAGDAPGAPAMRWAEEGEDGPTGPARRPGPRRNAT